MAQLQFSQVFICMKHRTKILPAVIGIPIDKRKTYTFHVYKRYTGRNSIAGKSKGWLEFGVYIPVSRGKANRERVLMEKQMTFWKDKWALRKLDGDMIVYDKFCLVVGPTSVSKKR